jgi:DNA polymerase III subunit gamma/tau
MSELRYLVSARKYRPRLFRELVAQDHVSDTLKNAIRMDRLAHAYLFSGPRGVGKTTAARILAKAINCMTPPEEREDAAEPCRQCTSCISFEEGRNLNIIEVDAASNNKVDDIRELRETVRVPPQGARKKVYIIDEVHMLSSGAFNALLKTLEEPPPYVLFIFATTEPHKVLPTILSRCQRFDFRRIAVEEITTHLQSITEQEGIKADEGSLMLIARKADGALRDALSAFDQAVALCGADLRYEELARALGTVDVDLYFDVTDAVLKHDSPAMLHVADALVQRGYDLQEFLVGLTEHLRNLFVAGSTGSTELIEATRQTRERYSTAASQFDEGRLLRLMMIADEAEEAVKHSPQPRLKLELALLKMALIASTEDLRSVLAKIDSGTAPPPPSAPEGTPTTKQSPDPVSRKVESPSVAHEVESAPRFVHGARKPTRPEGGAIPEAPEAILDSPADDSALSSEFHEIEANPIDRLAPSAPIQDRQSNSTETTNEPDKASSFVFGGEPALKRTVTGPQTPSSLQTVVEEDETPVAGQQSAVPQEAWERFIAAMKGLQVRLGAMLAVVTPRGVRNGQLTVTIPQAFFEDTLRSEEKLILEQLRQAGATGIDRLQFVIAEQVDTSKGETTREDDPYDLAKRMKDDHPVVRALFDKFGGEIVYN